MNNINHSYSSYSKTYDIILAAITWFGVILQMCNSTNIGNTLSFFTVGTNLLIAISLTTVAFLPNTKLGQFFLSPSVQSAILTYIIIVSLVYNIAIRPMIKEETTAGFFYDNILHVVTPIFYLVRWFIHVPKKTLKWHSGFAWLSFPLAYFVYSIIRGSITHWYTYFFADLNKISYSQFFINTLIVLAIFLAIGFIVIFMDHFFESKNSYERKIIIK